MSHLPADHDALRDRFAADARGTTPADADGAARWLTATWLVGDPSITTDTAARLGPSTPYADVTASPAGPSAALAFLAGLGQALPHLDQPDAWRDRLEDATADAIGRPAAWAALSELAWSLDAVPDRPSEATTRLLDAVGEAALRDQGAEAAADVRSALAAARRGVWLEDWREWAAHAVDAVAGPLRAALEDLTSGPQPMAAAGGTEAALARVRLFETADAELTVAVLPGQVVLEFTGSDAPPASALVDGVPLTPAPRATAADACWTLHAPPRSGATIELSGDGGVIRLAWP